MAVMQNVFLYCRYFVPVIKILRKFLQSSLFLTAKLQLANLPEHELLHRQFSEILTTDAQDQI